MRGRNLFIFAGFLVLGASVCVLILWANAQVEKKPLEPIPTVQPVPEKQPTSEKKKLQPPPIGQPIGERSPEYQPTKLQQIPQGTATEERAPLYQPKAFQSMPTLQGQDGIAYQVREFSDFKGGLDLVSAKTKVAPNCAIELESALWNPQGEMYKRPGYSVHSTPPEVLNFLYRYYQQDGDKWTMGGSDTALYFWHEDSSGDGWTYLIGTGGTSGRWDGTIFEDVFVGTHEGIVPVVWNGSTLVTMGTSIDSFQIEGSAEKNIAYSSCMEGSTRVDFDGTQTGWNANDWLDYTIGFWAYRDTAAFLTDTLYKYQIVMKNTADDVHINHIANYEGGILNDSYARFYSLFGIDSIWREGTIDSIATCAELCSCAVLIYDSTYYWDSTFTYDNYIFEITAGEGKGIKRWMNSYGYWVSVYSACSWDTLAFMLPGYTAGCFEIGSHYRIYAPAFIGKGAKFVENFDGSLWLGWTGTGDEQEKNRVVWSGLNDLGNWPPANEVWIESDDGDFITGMAKFPGEYTDVPRQEMIVTKNNSLYKIVPSGTGYDFWLIASGIGCVSNSAISPAEGLLLFPDQHGVWAYDKRKPVSISKLIDPIFEEWNLDALENVSAVYNPQDRHYYLSYPDSVFSDTGRVVVVWEDQRNSGHADIYAQVLVGYDSIVGSNIVVCDDDSIQAYPDVACDANGNFVVVWMDRYATAGANYDVYGRRYDFNGTALGEKFVIAGDADEMENFPTISMLPDGRFAVSWDQAQGTGIIYLYSKVYNSSGQLISTTRVCDQCDTDCSCCEYPCSDNCQCPTPACCCGTCECCGAYNYNLNHPCVGYDYSGMVNVVWSDHRHDDEGHNIHGNSVNKCGQRIHGCDDGIQVSDPNSTEPCIGIFYEGGFVTCWTEQVNDFDVYKTGAVVVNDNTTGIQRFSRVDVDKEGDYVIVWEDKRSGTEQIYGQRYNSSGAVGSNFLVDTVSGYTDSVQLEPDIAMDAEGNFVVVCEYERHATNSEVYLQRFDSSGAQVGLPINVDDDANPTKWQGHVRVALSKGTYIPSSNSKTIAWSFDHHGWSREGFSASVYAYQHSLGDPTKIIFAHPSGGVYDYATQADDVDDGVGLIYQSPYLGFGQYPSFDYAMRCATLEAFLDTGNVYLTWYKNYNDSTYYDSLVCGSDCREEMLLPEDLWGKNISMKLRTGSEVDDFTLSRFWWEWTVNQKFRK